MYVSSGQGGVLDIEDRDSCGVLWTVCSWPGDDQFCTAALTTGTQHCEGGFGSHFVFHLEGVLFVCVLQNIRDSQIKQALTAPH